MPSDLGGVIGLVGDIMIETPTVRARRKEVPGFDAALNALRGNEIAIGNLEMPLSSRGYRVPKHSNLRSSPEIMDDIVAMELDAVSLANNHMMDYGPEALYDTIEACRNANLPACGAGKDLDEALSPVILESSVGRVGMISVASTLPVESDAGPGKPGIAPIRVGYSFEIDANLLVEQPGTMPIVHTWAVQEDIDIVTKAIGELRKNVDTVIVAIHWGVPPWWMSPFQGLLAEYQQPLGHALIDAGADVIWGHHSHVLHPIEVYKGRPILYSLGNFIFEKPRSFMEPESFIVSITPGDPPGIVLAPIWVDEDGFPLLATSDQATAVIDRLEEISRRFGTRINRSKDSVHLSLE
jgi:poly-gamma-glutamate capsule biosynthesis protein CapA/YwtB (metallophosphatase superfamily)